MPGDVFKEHPFGFDFPDDAGDVGPEVAGIVSPLALSCGREWLAGVSGKHGVDRAAPRLSVEAGKIIPDRGRGEVSGPLGGNECLARVGFPFDKTAGVESGFGKHEAHVKATCSGTKGQSVSGT